MRREQSVEAAPIFLVLSFDFSPPPRTNKKLSPFTAAGKNQPAIATKRTTKNKFDPKTTDSSVRFHYSALFLVAIPSCNKRSIYTHTSNNETSFFY